MKHSSALRYEVFLFIYGELVSTTAKLSYSTSLVSPTTMSSNDGGKGKEPLKPSYREKVVKGSSSNSKSWADEMEELDNDVAEVDLNESAITDHCEDWEKKYELEIEVLYQRVRRPGTYAFLAKS